MKASKQFKVIIERDEDGYFVASVPALPGCYTQARDMDALHERLKEVIALCLSVARTNGAYRKKIKQFSYEPMFVGLDTVTVS
jgi:predicted RNase H-like HicB family nuclease